MHISMVNRNVCAIVICFLAAVMCACSNDDKSKVILAFVDFSGSAKSHRDLVVKDLQQVQAKLNPGDRFLIASITDRSLTEFNPILDQEIPAFRFWADNDSEYKHRLQEIMKDIETRIQNLQQYNYLSPKTDILNTFIIAQKVFAHEQRRKVLVLLSDMIENSESYNFERMRLTPEGIKEIIKSQRSKGLLPDLKGVHVYITGASAPSANKANEIEQFWIHYLHETGADFDDSRYASRLLRFDE